MFSPVYCDAFPSKHGQPKLRAEVRSGMRSISSHVLQPTSAT
jgi:hypothetical protein